MINFNKINRIKRQITFENPIAICVETSENGDMTYRTELVVGGVVEFYVPKKDTFIRTEKLKTQEWAINLLRFLVTENL